MLILSLPAEMLMEIATYLGTTRNLANFKMTCTRIYNVVESEKADRKRLPHLKIREIQFRKSKPSKIGVTYSQKHENSDKYRGWDHSDPLSTKLDILTRHWILEDDCTIVFLGGACIREISLLEPLLEINYGNAIECELNDSYRGFPNPDKYQEALPFIHEFLKKV